MMVGCSMWILHIFWGKIQSPFLLQWSFAKRWSRPWVVPKGPSSLSFSSCNWALHILCLLFFFTLMYFIFLGQCSQYYTRFKSYCCEAYNILRKSSNLILNLFHLMAGSNIPNIASDPEKSILKVLNSLSHFSSLFSL